MDNVMVLKLPDREVWLPEAFWVPRRGDLIEVEGKEYVVQGTRWKVTREVMFHMIPHIHLMEAPVPVYEKPVLMVAAGRPSLYHQEAGDQE